jgi:hypothetical protein
MSVILIGLIKKPGGSVKLIIAYFSVPSCYDPSLTSYPAIIWYNINKCSSTRATFLKLVVSTNP